jgi:glyoxylase-like metal-dependent hydrolase (beta-lactamase superfamily II)
VRADRLVRDEALAMDSRKPEKCHPFPQQLSMRIEVLGNRPFLVCGDRRSALIEAGISVTAAKVVRGRDSLKVTPDFIVITYPHADHMMGLAPLQEREPGIRVFVKPEEYNELLPPAAQAEP